MVINRLLTVLEWYKGLFQGSGQTDLGSSAGTGVSSSPGLSAAIPKLPVKRNGDVSDFQVLINRLLTAQVHVTNMRRMVSEMGHKIPCESCENRTDCCKDINKCDHFVLFECGELAPKQATPEVDAEAQAQLEEDIAAFNDEDA